MKQSSSLTVRRANGVCIGLLFVAAVGLSATNMNYAVASVTNCPSVIGSIGSTPCSSGLRLDYVGVDCQYGDIPGEGNRGAYCCSYRTVDYYCGNTYLGRKQYLRAETRGSACNYVYGGGRYQGTCS